MLTAMLECAVLSPLSTKFKFHCPPPDPPLGPSQHWRPLILVGFILFGFHLLHASAIYKD